MSAEDTTWYLCVESDQRNVLSWRSAWERDVQSMGNAV